MAVIVALVAVPHAAQAAVQAADPVAAARVLLRNAMMEATTRPRPAMTPRASFLLRREILEVHLSPDGRHLSFLRRNEGGVDVILQDAGSGTQTRVATGLQRAETAWSGDGRRLWLADEQGLAVIEEAGLSRRRIVKWDTRTKQRLWAVDARAPRYAIVYEQDLLRGVARHRYLRVDAGGTSQLLIESAWPLRSMLLDANGELAFTAAFDGARYETVIRQHTAKGPRALLRCSSLETCRLVGYNKAQQTLWLLSQHDEDKLALRRWRRDAGRWDTVHRDPTGVADAYAVLWSAAQEGWLAMAYHDGRRRWYGNSNGDSNGNSNGSIDRTTAVLSALERQLPGANLQLSASADHRVWLVEAQQGDQALDRYFLYRPEQRLLQPLFGREDAATRMPPRGATMHPVSYRARDGMLLHGYVLLPSGRASGKTPLIAWLHGGPITRTYDQYEASMQLLVNRGCAVFVPNFRASTGYGLDYVLSARGDVGNGRVLADILDGMDFLLALGVGNRDQQAVMGLSFGGYASLLAVSHQPTRFRFAFAGVPPTDYGWIKQWQAEHDSDELRAGGPPLSLQFQQLGFRYTDATWRQQMQRESPLATVRALQAPVYIWAGARDDRVPLKSIVQYASNARRLGKSLTLLIDPDGAHGPTSVLGTEASLYLIELAAHRHFGGGLSPVSPELQAFLRRNLRMDADPAARTAVQRPR
ncbi:MAG: S9 family peptidase [Acidobacteria bacterium]|nr:S9 family peptidase [Acidobacteriota bacterium]